MKKSEDFLCLTIFRISYKKMQIWSSELRRNAAAAAAWITLQIPKCKKTIANLNTRMYFHGKQTNCGISKIVRTAALYCTVALNLFVSQIEDAGFAYFHVHLIHPVMFNFFYICLICLL